MRICLQKLNNLGAWGIQHIPHQAHVAGIRRTQGEILPFQNADQLRGRCHPTLGIFEKLRVHDLIELVVEGVRLDLRGWLIVKRAYSQNDLSQEFRGSKNE